MGKQLKYNSNNIFKFDNETYENYLIKQDLNKLNIQVNDDDKYTSFKSIEKNFIGSNLSNKIYQENALYNNIVNQIFKNINYVKNKFSVIIPLFNAENLITITLDSIYNSNTENINFEVIIINDESTDTSVNVINNYIKQNNITNLIVLHNKKNQGAYISRNRGIFHSTGEFIFILDSDDMISDDRFQNDISLFQSKDVECVISKLIKYDYIEKTNSYKLTNEYEEFPNGKFKEISVT